jgi:3,4-dihydroxy 2-butanone 4-phosphate synthase/GTP cyclohydrolase II
MTQNLQAVEDDFDSVEQAIAAIAAGGFAVVVDDTDRENEGDLIIAAEKITAQQMAFLVRYSSGVVCVALTGERLDQLQLPLMVSSNNESQRTAFTVTVDYLHGTSTGISAADRAATLRALADSRIPAGDFARPGHIFPCAMRRVACWRAGHTEAALDLSRLAGLAPAGVLCEIVNDDGSMARRPELLRFARQHGLPIITIADLIAYRERTEMAALAAPPQWACRPDLARRTASCTRHGGCQCMQSHLVEFTGVQAALLRDSACLMSIPDSSTLALPIEQGPSLPFGNAKALLRI